MLKWKLSKFCLFVKNFENDIDKIYKNQVKECGGEDYLISINDQNVARALFVYDDFFIKFLNFISNVIFFKDTPLYYQ